MWCSHFERVKIISRETLKVPQPNLRLCLKQGWACRLLNTVINTSFVCFNPMFFQLPHIVPGTSLHRHKDCSNARQAIITFLILM